MCPKCGLNDPKARNDERDEWNEIEPSKLLLVFPGNLVPDRVREPAADDAFRADNLATIRAFHELARQAKPAAAMRARVGYRKRKLVHFFRLGN